MEQAVAQAFVKDEDLLAQEFTEEQLKSVSEIIQAYRNKPGALIPVLKEIQDVTGHLPLPLQREIAKGLNLAYSEVYGVVTFYSFFNIEPRGKHLIKVCLGTACYVRGNKDLVANLSRDLGCKVGGTTEDRRFTMDGVRCLGCCGIAPVITVDDHVYKEVRAKEVPSILEKYE